jgi:hypothetical protein
MSATNPAETRLVVKRGKDWTRRRLIGRARHDESFENARVVNEDVHFAERGNGPLEELSRRQLERDVSVDWEEVIAIAELLGGRFQPVDRARVSDDIASLLEVGFRKREADAARGAGNDDGAVVGGYAHDNDGVWVELGFFLPANFGDLDAIDPRSSVETSWMTTWISLGFLPKASVSCLVTPAIHLFFSSQVTPLDVS